MCPATAPTAPELGTCKFAPSPGCAIAGFESIQHSLALFCPHLSWASFSFCQEFFPLSAATAGPLVSEHTAWRGVVAVLFSTSLISFQRPGISCWFYPGYLTFPSCSCSSKIPTRARCLSVCEHYPSLRVYFLLGVLGQGMQFLCLFFTVTSWYLENCFREKFMIVSLLHQRMKPLFFIVVFNDFLNVT